MKKKISLFTLSILFIYFIYGLFLSRYEVQIFPSKLEVSKPEGVFDYTGVINVQSAQSSGSGSLKHIVSEAQKAELDFLILTDLNQFDVESAQEGYHDNLLLFIDGEYSYLDSRLLNIDAQDKTHLKGPGQSQALIADLISQKDKNPLSGLFILAHPLKPGYQWQGSYPPGLDGIEIINLKSIWQNAWLHSKASFLWTLFIYPFNPKLAFTRLIENAGHKEAQLWDNLNKDRSLIAFAGTDADAKVKILKNSFINFPSYSMLFSIVRNHVLLKSELTGRDKHDRKKISNALREGQFYMSFDILGEAKGFQAYMTSPANGPVLMGQHLNLENDLKLYVQLPDKPLFPFEVIVYKDGEKFSSSNKVMSEFSVPTKGTYRVYVRVIPTLPFPDGRKWMPWIYTNSFYVN